MLLILKALLIEAYVFASNSAVPLSKEVEAVLTDGQKNAVFYGYFVTFAVWAAKTIYDAFLKKQDKTEEKMDKMLESLVRLEENVRALERMVYRGKSEF